MSWNQVYWRRKALREEWKTMFGNVPYEHFISEKGKKAWEARKAELTKEANGNIAEAAIGYGATRAIGSAMTAPVRIATEYAVHMIKKNYDRGFINYRTKPYYVNYNIRPVRVRRRYTRAYRPNLKAYSLPFYYSREGPAYKHNRRTRNFWYWRR